MTMMKLVRNNSNTTIHKRLIVWSSKERPSGINSSLAVRKQNVRCISSSCCDILSGGPRNNNATKLSRYHNNQNYEFLPQNSFQRCWINTDISSSSTTTSSNEKSLLSQIVLEHHYDEETNATITSLVLNRPNAANAMGSVMLKELQHCLSELSSAEKTNKSRCLILSSSHPKVFSAGADLKERSKMSIDEAEEFVTSLRNTMHQVSLLPIPVIAVIEGIAVGGGLELALAADIRISSTKAVFGLPETTLAIIPGAGGTQRLSRMIGISRAKELIFTGKRIDAQTAYDYGILQHLVDEEENSTGESSSSLSSSFSSSPAYEKALEMAWDIAKKSGPIAIQAAKQAIDDGYYTANTMEEALEMERQHYQRTLTTNDRLEGLAAFREKRSPIYKGE